jgi:predicted nuclease of restriction endonuclease-like (RecB) superfamily
MSDLNPQDYANFFHEIKGYIRDRQLQAMRSVNRELVALYWDIGELIHQKQQALGWGKSVVETLARDLQAEFPGRNGFSANNLWLMRQFYCEYVDKPNLQSMIGEISWTKNLVIFGRCKDDLEREFYLRATARFGWTTAVLKHQVDNKSYEKYLLNQTNFDVVAEPVTKALGAVFWNTSPQPCNWDLPPPPNEKITPIPTLTLASQFTPMPSKTALTMAILPPLKSGKSKLT